MLHSETIENDGDDAQEQQRHRSMVIGDVLLHSGIKSRPIQIITRSPPVVASAHVRKGTIPRLVPKLLANKIGPNSTACDLKNLPSGSDARRRSLASISLKTMMDVQRFGVALIERIKTRCSQHGYPVEPENLF